MNLLTTALIGLLVAMIGMAFVSAWVLRLSINELDAAGAWVWMAVFAFTSILSAVAFWGLL